MPMDEKMPTAEDHWDALIENNPDMAHAFALGLARMGVPIANFLRHTNSALATFAQDPSGSPFWKEIAGSKPIGEKFVPDSAILHPSAPPASETQQVNDYVAKRYGRRE
jgi:hypothetical protein